jgi:next-to-BRCA1 protein 1
VVGIPEVSGFRSSLLTSDVADFTGQGSSSSLVNDMSTLRLNMSKLLAMGFGNRALNERLLTRHNQNLDQVVNDLIERLDNNWTDHR